MTDGALAFRPEGLVPYDLTAPVRLLVPAVRPFLNANTPQGRAEIARRRAEDEARQARSRELLAAARAGWLTARERLAGNVPAVLVLDIHRPAEGFTGPVCSECREPFYDDFEPVTWACPTYRAVTGEA